jgi:hypothetical protein
VLGICLIGGDISHGVLLYVVKPPTHVAAVDAVCGQELSPLSGIGVCGAYCLGAGWYWFQDCAGLVDRDSVGGGQGSPGGQVVVAAQQ